jgi:hypothetical protein
MHAVTRLGGRANISRLSVVTGMTRKEVSALLTDSRKEGGALTRRSGQQRAMRVLSGWLTDPRFRDRNGRPGELKYRAGRQSFAVLVKLYGGDVTPRSVLRELERIEVVDSTNAGLRLRMPRRRSDIEIHYKLSNLAKEFENFAYAVSQQTLGLDARSFFGFRDSALSSDRDAAYFMRRFSRRASAFLEDFQQWSVGREPMKSASRREQAAIRVGLGVYLLRSDQQRSAHNPRKRSTASVGVPRSERRRS